MRYPGRKELDNIVGIFGSTCWSLIRRVRQRGTTVVRRLEDAAEWAGLYISHADRARHAVICTTSKRGRSSPTLPVANR
jgi:hypothetical protein